LRSERETADVSYDSETSGATTYNAISKSQTTNSLFSIYQFTPAKNVDLSVGGRVDSVLSGDRFVTWRTTGAYRFDESDTKIHSSIGTGAKIATLYQRYSEYGISTLKSERSLGYDLGIDQKITNRLSGSVSVFENKFENLIAYTSGATGCLSTYGCYYNVGLAKTRGTEVAGDLILVPDVWRTRLSYTNLWSRDLSTQKELLQRPRHKTAWSLTYTGVPKLEVEARLTYVGVRYDYASGGDQRLDPFTKIDAYASYKVRESLTVFSRLENLTNGRYQEAYQFGAPGRSLYGGLRVNW
jgi:vitamin B12 transporter